MQFESNVVIGVGSEGACARPRWALGRIAHAQIATCINGGQS
jgi:hypothetical protein